MPISVDGPSDGLVQMIAAKMQVSKLARSRVALALPWGVGRKGVEF